MIICSSPVEDIVGAEANIGDEGFQLGSGLISCKLKQSKNMLKLLMWVFKK